jgi:hypothetical protein
MTEEEKKAMEIMIRLINTDMHIRQGCYSPDVLEKKLRERLEAEKDNR